MRVFDVINKTPHGFFVAAVDEEGAKAIALADGHVKDTDNAMVIDITDQFSNEKGIPEIIAGERTGRLVKQLFADFVSGVRVITGGQWMFAADISKKQEE